MTRKYSTVLIDVGGTLWPNAFEEERHIRLRRVRVALPLEHRSHADRLLELVDAVDEPRLDRAARDESPRDALQVLRQAVERVTGLTSEEVVDAVRRALVTPARPGRLFPGAVELLREIRALEIRCGAISNTEWRNGDDHRRDFDTLGVLENFDAIITSVDVGVRKPDPAIFEEALARLGGDPHEAISIGDSEAMDIVPARALGMYTIRVAIEEPAPPATEAHALVTSLLEARRIVRELARAR